MDRFEEVLDDIREELGLESTHYLVLADQVSDVVIQQQELFSCLEYLLPFLTDQKIEGGPWTNYEKHEIKLWRDRAQKELNKGRQPVEP